MEMMSQPPFSNLQEEIGVWKIDILTSLDSSELTKTVIAHNTTEVTHPR